MKIEPRVHELLGREPGVLAVVGTNGADGMPHLVPVWFRWDGSEVHIWSLESRAWIRNLRRDPRVGISAQEESRSGMAVMLKGHARVETGESAAMHEEIRAICRRYVPPDELDAYIASWSSLRTMVHIAPSRIFVWG